MLYSMPSMDSQHTTRGNNHAAKKRYQLVQALSRKWLMRHRPEVLRKLEREARKRYPRVVNIKDEVET